MSDPTHRRGGNPAMVKGGPSLNPRGRPRRGLSLAEAMRERFPLQRICDLAEELATGADDDRVRMQALSFIADRAHGKAPQVVKFESDDGDEFNLSGVPVERQIALLGALDALDEIAVTSEADEAVEH